jgi:hypothetical protein
MSSRIIGHDLESRKVGRIDSNTYTFQLCERKMLREQRLMSFPSIRNVKCQTNINVEEKVHVLLT